MKLSKSKLETIRARQCLKVSDVAKLAGVSLRTISKQAYIEIGPVTAGKIARALNVDIEEILAGDDHA